MLNKLNRGFLNNILNYVEYEINYTHVQKILIFSPNC